MSSKQEQTREKIIYNYSNNPARSNFLIAKDVNEPFPIF
jgi:hypothetical protein